MTLTDRTLGSNGQLSCCLPALVALGMFGASLKAVVECFYIALFSALEQTHCTLAMCDFKSVTVSFYSTF